MAIFRFIFLLLLSMPVLAEMPIGDAVVEAQEIGERVEKLFFARQFKSIQVLDKELQTSREKQRLSDGRWSITFLYSELSACSCNSQNFDEWKLKEKIANEWIAQSPDQMSPRLARAAIQLGYAWAMRGGGYASQVPDENMAAFKRQVARARQTLEDPLFEKQKHPLWFFYMLDIAKLQSWDKKSFNGLFNAAVETYPGYEFLYFQATLYHQPFWHGSKEELKHFVDESVERTRAKEGMVMYTRLYWYMLDQLGDRTFDAGNAQWEPMKQGFERLMHDYPKSKWNLNAFGYYACMARDWETIKTLQPSIGDTPAVGIWQRPSRYYTCIEKAKESKR